MCSGCPERRILQFHGGRAGDHHVNPEGSTRDAASALGHAVTPDLTAPALFDNFDGRGASGAAYPALLLHLKR